MSLKLSKTKLAVIALIIANVIWGAASPIFKWSLVDFDPFTFGFLRFFLAALIILPFTIHKLRISMNAFVKLFVISYLGMFLHITYLLFGLEISQSINAPVIGSSAPVFLILGSILFLGEKPKKKMLLGTFFSLVGVLLIILQPILVVGFDGSILGNIFFIFSMLTAVIYAILLKKFRLPYDLKTIMFWIFAIAAFTYLPFFLWETKGVDVFAQMTPQALFGTIYGGLFASVIAYICFSYALRYLVANEVGIFFYVDPIIALIIAVPLLGEQITPLFIIGSFLVFLGIFIAENRIHFHPIHKLREKNSPA